MAEWVRNTQRETPKVSDGGDTEPGPSADSQMLGRHAQACRDTCDQPLLRWGTALPSAGETFSALETVGGRGSLGGATFLGEDGNKWMS